jgi:hypothetical protein
MRRAVDDLDGTIREIRSTIYGLHSGEQALPTLRTRVLQVVDAGTEQLASRPTCACPACSTPGSRR